MTVNFSLLALDQIVNNAATLLHMSGGQFNVPARDPHDHRRGSPARRPALPQPRGLVRAHPRDPRARARHPRGRPRHALDRRSRTPTRCSSSSTAASTTTKGELADDAGRRRHHRRPSVRRPGADVTLIAYGGTLRTALGAAEELGGGGRRRRGHRPAQPAAARHRRPSCRRWPGPTERSSSTKDGDRGACRPRCSARITEDVFYDLDAPVARVCSAEVPMPYAKHLEDARLAPGRRRRGRRAPTGGAEWASSACPRSAPTWRPAVVSEWLVKPGDEVHRGDIVAVVETEKSTIEVEIFETGVIEAIRGPRGERGPGGDRARPGGLHPSKHPPRRCHHRASAPAGSGA